MFWESLLLFVRVLQYHCFLGFVESGVPLGVTFSFLIAAPMINEIAVVLLFGLFGWKTAVIYMVTGLAIAILAGYVIGKLKLERYVEDWVYKIKAGNVEIIEERISFSQRIDEGFTAVKEIVGKVWIYIVLGIAVGAAIHGYVPENFMAGLMGKVGLVVRPCRSASGCSYVLECRRDNSYRAGFAGKRSFTRNCACLYDECNRAFAS